MEREEDVREEDGEGEGWRGRRMEREEDGEGGRWRGRKMERSERNFTTRLLHTDCGLVWLPKTLTNVINAHIFWGKSLGFSNCWYGWHGCISCECLYKYKRVTEEKSRKVRFAVCGYCSVIQEKLCGNLHDTADFTSLQMSSCV